MAQDEYALDVLYRLRERYRHRVEKGDPGAPSILTAIEDIIEDHERRAADAATPRRGTNRGMPPA